MKSKAKLPRYWQPLEASYVGGPHPEWAIKLQMEKSGSREAAIAAMTKYDNECRYFSNNIYQVQMRWTRAPEYVPFFGERTVVHLNIRRRDGAVDMRDWRHFQQIKNELVGPECEGVELYPADSRLVDTSNKFHIWVVMDAEFRFPFGFENRDVLGPQPDDNVPGVRQREF